MELNDDTECADRASGIEICEGNPADIHYFDAELKRKIIVNPALPDMEQTFSGDDTGFGFNIGLHVKITDRIFVALSSVIISCKGVKR
jgi:hypothetical protein